MQKYRRKPEYVMAVRVDNDSMERLAREVRGEFSFTQNALFFRGQTAYVGDFLVKTADGEYIVREPVAFLEEYERDYT